MLLPNKRPGKAARTSPDGDLVARALDYLQRGWSIIPVVDKKAAGLWKPFQSTPPDETTLKALLARRNVSGVAVILGEVSEMLGCRDFDDPKAYQRWKERNPSLADELPTARTGRGYHVYFTAPREAYEDLGDGEYRADSGHYAVLPPSRHESGRAYQWIREPKGRLPEIDPVGDELILPMLARTSDPLKELTQDRLIQPQHAQQPIACVSRTVEEAIAATLPTGPGQRNRRIFDFARQLKSINGLDTSPSSLLANFASWHEQALPFIRTKEFDESWLDFQIAWRRLKAPLRATTVQAAYEAALAAPMELHGNVALGTLAGLCRQLGLGSQDGRFFLAVGTVATLFGVSRTTAWRWLQSLQFSQIIQLVSKGKLEDRRASTWLYIGLGDLS
jgi:hypothetical protein